MSKNKDDKPEATAEISASELNNFVMPRSNVLCDKFTEVIATQMHYFDKSEGFDFTTATHQEVNQLHDGWMERYQSDQLFNAKVKSIVEQLLLATQKERDERLVMRFQHDCKHCVPLGQYQENDLYYCDQDGCPTVIARYGSDGQDCTSGMGFADIDPRLGIARMMAVAMDLYDA